MKVLVTGGAGFVGSHLVDTLVNAGHDVVVVDHYRRNKQRFENPNAALYKLSFHDPAVEEVLRRERPEAICHLAAQISVTHSVAHPLEDAQVNILNSIALLEYARRHGVGQFVFASSGGAIYGDHPERPTPEVHGARPLSPYGISKQSLEHFLDFYREAHGMKAGVLRFSNIYGPRQFSGGEASVISIFINKLLSGEPATMFGDGSSTRDFLFVRDAVQAFSAALDAKLDDTVNVSSGSEIAVRDLWEMLKEIHGSDHEHVLERERPGEVKCSCLSPQKARRVMGWVPNTSLREGLEETYAWFRERALL